MPKTPAELYHELGGIGLTIPQSDLKMFSICVKSKPDKVVFLRIAKKLLAGVKKDRRLPIPGTLTVCYVETMYGVECNGICGAKVLTTPRKGYGVLRLPASFWNDEIIKEILLVYPTMEAPCE